MGDQSYNAVPPPSSRPEPSKTDISRDAYEAALKRAKEVKKQRLLRLKNRISLLDCTQYGRFERRRRYEPTHSVAITYLM